MLFTSPVFTVTTYLQEPDSYNYGLDMLHVIGPNNQAGKELFDHIVARQTTLKTPLIDLYVDIGDGKPLLWKDKNIGINDLRKSEKQIS